MEGTLITWTLPDASKTETSRLAKILYGQFTSSHQGRYVYWRRGFLDDIPYVKLIRAAFIVSKRDSQKVVRFLKENDAKVFTRRVILIARDERVLRGHTTEGQTMLTSFM